MIAGHRIVSEALEVADHLSEVANPATGCGEEFGKLLHGVLLLIAFRRGGEMRIGKECCTGHGRSEADDLEVG